MAQFANLFSSKTSLKGKREVIFVIANSRFDAEVVGEQNYQDALEAICGQRVPRGVHRYETAWLKLEDKNRVRVEIRGRQVGYLGADAAIQYCKQLTVRGKPNADGQCQAVIRGGWIHSHGRKGPYCESLDLPNLSS